MLKLVNLLKSFKNEESGAVTVDWVVLTGAIVALGIAVSGSIGSSVESAATSIGADITGN